MNKEKQIEEIEKVLYESDNKRNVLICGIETVAEDVYNANFRKQEWISVDERLPEEKVNCLVHYKHAYCDNDGYWDIGVSFYDGHEFHIGLEYKVTHWMPLPEAPKMKGGAE